MIGSPVGEFSTLSRSPRVNIRQIMNVNCMMLFSVTAVIILCGTLVRGPLTSSPTQVSVHHDPGDDESFQGSVVDLLMCRIPSKPVNLNVNKIHISLWIVRLTGNWKGHRQQTDTPRHSRIRPTTQVMSQGIENE